MADININNIPLGCPKPGELLPGEELPIPSNNNPPFWNNQPDNRRPVEPSDSRLSEQQNNTFYDSCANPEKPDPTAWSCEPCKRHDKDNLATLGLIDTLVELRAYILRKLGSPVICVELSTEQLNDIIMDAVRYCQKYLTDEGNYKDYLAIQLNPGQTKYKLCEELESIIDFQTSDWLGSINDMFSFPAQMMYSDFVQGTGVYGGRYDDYFVWRCHAVIIMLQ